MMIVKKILKELIFYKKEVSNNIKNQIVLLFQCPVHLILISDLNMIYNRKKLFDIIAFMFLDYLFGNISFNSIFKLKNKV